MQKLLYGVIAFVALLLVIGFALPRAHQIEVSAEIDAPPATVFALLNDFRRHALWSPMLETDPDLRIVYSGSPRGVGATMSWDGAIAGSGTQSIVASAPFETVRMRINPGEPGEAASHFRLVPGTGTTVVYWGFHADYGMNLAGRYFAAMLGGVVARDYQRGLSNLKALAESLPRADFSDLVVEHMDIKAADIALVTARSRRDTAAKSAALGRAYFQLMSYIDEAGLEIAGAPLSVIRSIEGAELSFDAAIPVRGVAGPPQSDGAGVRLGKSHEGSVIRVRHVGPYRRLGETHRKISAYLAAHGIERNGAAWEAYVTDPGDVPEAELLTYIYYPVKPTL